MSTLVIGARGGIGRHVVEQLRTAGESVRASVREPATAGLPAGVPVVAADLADADSLTAAMTGVRSVFLYAPTGGAGAFVTAARRAQPERIVVLSSGSVLLPGTEHNAIAEEHRAVERALADADLPWLPIRPLVLAANALRWADSIRAERVVRLVRPDAVSAPIHERDVAAVAVAALTGGTGPVTGMLTGPEPLTQRRQVALLGAGIRVVELTETQARQRFGRAERPEVVEAILAFLAAAERDGSPVTDTVPRVLGRPATPFADWVRDHAAEFALGEIG